MGKEEESSVEIDGHELVAPEFVAERHHREAQIAHRVQPQPHEEALRLADEVFLCQWCGPVAALHGPRRLFSYLCPYASVLRYGLQVGRGRPLTLRLLFSGGGDLGTASAERGSVAKYLARTDRIFDKGVRHFLLRQKTADCVMRGP